MAQAEETARFKGDAYVPCVPGLTYGALDDDAQTPIEELVISSDVSSPCEALCLEDLTRLPQLVPNLASR